MADFAHGKPQAFMSIQPAQYKEHPVWEACLDGYCDDPEHDESWRWPLLGCRDADSNMILVYVALRIVGHPRLTANAAVSWDTDSINNIFVWWQGNWIMPGGVPSLLGAPVVFEAVPKLEGEANVRFRLENPRDFTAQRVWER